jgi:cobalamin biosynthesis protein CobD/CbiB
MDGSPWFLGLAPLLGWCLDAIVRSRRIGPLLPNWAARTTGRLEFVMRTGLPDKPLRAGDILVLWIMVLAWIVGWVLSKGSWVLFGAFGQFVVWTAMFFLMISVRRRAGAGRDIQASLMAQRPDLARGWLEHIDHRPADDEPTTLARAGVGRMAEGILETTLLGVFWGVLLGPAAGLAAVCVHEVARYGRRSEDPDDPLWFGALRMERWLSWPISWLAAFVLYVVVPLGGGNRAQALAGYFNKKRERPANRLSAALIQGLGLQRVQTPDGIIDPVVPQDIQRSVVVLWAATCVATLGCAAFSCGVQFLLG